MSDDWQPGDLALCVSNRPIRDSRFNESLARLVVGAVYTVRLVGAEDGYIALNLVEVQSSHPDGGFLAPRFRKIRPHQPDAEDAETIALLKGGRVLA